jgi:hypothetical protein
VVGVWDGVTRYDAAGDYNRPTHLVATNLRARMRVYYAGLVGCDAAAYVV